MTTNLKVQRYRLYFGGRYLEVSKDVYDEMASLRLLTASPIEVILHRALFLLKTELMPDTTKPTMQDLKTIRIITRSMCRETMIEKKQDSCIVTNLIIETVADYKRHLRYKLAFPFDIVHRNLRYAQTLIGCCYEKDLQDRLIMQYHDIAFKFRNIESLDAFVCSISKSDWEKLKAASLKNWKTDKYRIDQDLLDGSELDD